MYWKVEYASWLKATYGLSESIPELVPSLKVPPLFEPEPPADVAKTAIATAQTPIIDAAAHRLFISPSSTRRSAPSVYRNSVRVGNVVRTRLRQRLGLAGHRTRH